MRTNSGDTAPLPPYARSNPAFMMKSLNESLESYGMLNAIEKPLVVAAILLRMQDKSFDISQLEGKSSPTDGEIICSESTYPKLSFIATRAVLNTINSEIGYTPLRYFAEQLMNEDKYDVISRMYGGKYSYSGKDGHDLGIVLTPIHITDMCCKLLELKPGDRVLEPCCGTGRFLVNAMKYVGDNVKGLEVQEDLYTLSSINVKVNGGVNSGIELRDFFKDDLSGRKFTAGFMNPPYSQAKTELEFTEQLLNSLEIGGRAAVLVPVSTMIGKTAKDRRLKAEILKSHTLEGVISLNKDTFYGVGTVPCIAVFTAGEPHPSEKRVKFINFEQDGWEVKMHTGLIETESAKDRLKYLLECWNGQRRDYGTSFMVETVIASCDEWLHSFYYYNDEIPAEKDFADSLADYLTFEFNMIVHGRGYLFVSGKEGTKIEEPSKPRQCEILFEE